jgi:hypothetical protein
VIERLVARLIEQLDEQDGDTDIESNGDELDGSAAEDDWHNGSRPGELSYVAANDCEDAEEDDPGGGNIEDEPHDDFGEAEPEEGVTPPQYGIDQRIIPPWHSFGNRAWEVDHDRLAKSP